jgi:hypothetical protein
VSAVGKGLLHISKGGRFIASIKNGNYLEASSDALEHGVLGSTLTGMSVAFQDAVYERLKKTLDDEEDWGNYPGRYFMGFLRRVLQAVKQGGHGGTIVLIPNSWRPRDLLFRDRFRIKYPIDDGQIWETLLECLCAKRRYHEERFSHGKRKRITSTQLARMHELDYAMTDCDDLVRDKVRLVASLTAVDGAVVMNRQLHLFGFGAEITAGSGSLDDVLVMRNDKSRGVRTPIDDFGTRHRSAMRLCASHEGPIAMIVSEDGAVRVAMKVGPDVVLWPNIALRD